MVKAAKTVNLEVSTINELSKEGSNFSDVVERALRFYLNRDKVEALSESELQNALQELNIKRGAVELELEARKKKADAEADAVLNAKRGEEQKTQDTVVEGEARKWWKGLSTETQVKLKTEHKKSMAAKGLSFSTWLPDLYKKHLEAKDS